MDLTDEIRKVNRTALFLAHETARVNPELARLLFGVDGNVARLLADMGSEPLNRLSDFTLPLVTLRDGDNPLHWQQINDALALGTEEPLKAAYASCMLKMTDLPGACQPASISLPAGSYHDL